MNKRRQMAAALLAAGGIGMAAAGGKLMNQQIEVASRDGKVLVTMQFDNRSAATLYVPKQIAEDGELFGNHFEVKEAASGKVLDYVGPMVKRAPFGPEDYVPVKAKGKLRSVLDISRAYAFLPGQHTYQLRYAGNYVADLKQVDKVTPVVTPVVTFTHTQK
jgi:hypothetical protein